MSIADKLSRLSDARDNIITALGNKGVTATGHGIEDFATDIASITSGGVTPVEQKDVNFIDYDGTILHSYTAAEFANLSALPANPTHTGLTAQGWNWSLSAAKTYVAANGKLWIGQMYTTSDGKTRIYIHLEEGRLSPYLGIAVNGTATVEWGDGSSNSTVTGTSTSTVINTQHNYATGGDYVIAISVSGSMGLKGDSSYGSRVLWKNNTTGNLNRVYQNAIRKVEIGSNTGISSYAFAYCYSLSSITLPSGVGLIDINTFYYCYDLSSITLPSRSSINNNGFRGCNSLVSIAMPKGCSINDYAFYTCYALLSIATATSLINQYAFAYCYSLSSITIPSNVSYIYAYAFAYCYGLSEIHFKSTSPPGVNNDNAWTGLPTDCIIYVPYSALASYLTGTNYPSPSTYTYIGYATYNSGVTLPTQDSTAVYNVTWYATQADALARSNAITQGNGNEIYCRYQ